MAEKTDMVLATTTPNAMMIMPVYSREQAVARRDAFVGFVSDIMVKDVDYGPIPGTGQDGKPGKNVLLKPGAEKLISFFGLRTEFEFVKLEEDWDGKDHSYNGEPEPFLGYIIKCKLYSGDMLIASADAAANSRESKWRWRNAKRKCPVCGANAIIKGQAQYGGGWICFKKQDGCGAKFTDNDPYIVDQQVGRILNPDLADLQNTIIKMGEKRAYVAATLLGTNASEFFTQDIEESMPSVSTSGAESNHADHGVVDAEYRDEPNQQASKPRVDMGALRKKVMNEFQRVTGGKANTGKNDPEGKSAIARLKGYLKLEDIEGGAEALASLDETMCNAFLAKLRMEHDWKPKAEPSEKPADDGFALNSNPDPAAEAQEEVDAFAEK